MRKTAKIKALEVRLSKLECQHLYCHFINDFYLSPIGIVWIKTCRDCGKELKRFNAVEMIDEVKRINTEG